LKDVKESLNEMNLVLSSKLEARDADELSIIYADLT